MEGEKRLKMWLKGYVLNFWNKRAGHSPLGDVELVESDRAAERVLRVLHHLQDFLFIHAFLSFFSWDAVCV